MSTKSTWPVRERPRDVVLEADAEPNERLTEQLALLALGERAVELLVVTSPLRKSSAPRRERGSSSKKVWSSRAGRIPTTGYREFDAMT